MLEYEGYSQPVSDSKGHPPSERVLRYQEYKRRRDAIETPFLEKLKTAELLASGILQHHRHREIVEPSLWDEIELDYRFEDLIGEGYIFTKAEFFEPTSIPLNVHDVPRWLASYIGYQPRLDHLEFDHTFRHLKFKGKEYHLGEIQGRVVKQLYEAAVAGSPLVNGKVLLSRAGSQQTKMRDFMKNTALRISSTPITGGCTG
jgi:hypothetical protein